MQPILPQEPQSPEQKFQVPRPRLIHLFVWLGLVVALIWLDTTFSAVQARALRREMNISVLVPWWTQLGRMLAVVGFAACLVASCVLIRARCFGKLRRLQPGHWLVLILALGGTLGAIVSQTEWFAARASLAQNWKAHAYLIVAWSSLVVVGACYLFAAVRLRD